MQIHKCDVCGILGEPGVRWVRVQIQPFTIQPQNPSMEVPYYEELWLDVCGIDCVRDKLLDYDFVTDNRKSILKASISSGLTPAANIRSTLEEPVESDPADFPVSRMELGRE